MGFLDNIQNTMNRGTAAAERTARKMKVNQRINEINRDRQKLAAQLGASLYEVTRENPELREGRESLYDGIASLDTERANCQQELAAIEAAAAAEAAAAQTFVCTHCGANIGATDMFCSSCGTSMEVIKAELAAQNPAPAPAATLGRTCANCGAPMADDDVFCMNCGTKSEPAAQAAPAAEPAPVAAAAPVAEPMVTPEPTPVVEPTPAVEPTPVVEPAPATEPEPVVEAVEDTAAAPVVDPITEPAPEPVVEETPAPAAAESQPSTVDASSPKPTTADELIASLNLSDFANTSTTSSAAPSVNTCPTCGAILNDGDVFCGGCGSKVGA